MSDQRDGGISWTDETWNPVRGCSRVSPGCDHCYAMGQAHRFSNEVNGKPGPYQGLTLLRPKTAKRPGVDWSGRVRFVPEMLGEPLRWREPKRVFVNSMSDLFHESLTNEEILRIFAVMAVTPHHTYQVLTKRPARAETWFSDVDLFRLSEQMRYLDLPANGRSYPRIANKWPLPNVWLGVSAENQETANKRIPILLELPAAVRFVSAEPLLGPLDLSRWVRCSSRCGRNASHSEGRPVDFQFLDWVIVGGESGNGARPFDLDWARSLVKQCAAAKVACFVKQMGADPIDGLAGCSVPFASKKGGDINEWPAELRVQQFPESAGRE